MYGLSPLFGYELAYVSRPRPDVAIHVTGKTESRFQCCGEERLTYIQISVVTFGCGAIGRNTRPFDKIDEPEPSNYREYGLIFTIYL